MASLERDLKADEISCFFRNPTGSLGLPEKTPYSAPVGRKMTLAVR
jgi:hypothetical protein